MATIVDLGQKVKAKYPGQYDDLSDADLGRKVREKFPGQYDDFTDEAPPVQAVASHAPDSTPAARAVVKADAAPSPTLAALKQGITAGTGSKAGAAIDATAAQLNAWARKHAPWLVPDDPTVTEANTGGPGGDLSWTDRYETAKRHNLAMDDAAREADPNQYALIKTLGGILPASKVMGASTGANLIGRSAALSGVEGAGESRGETVGDVVRDASLRSALGAVAAVPVAVLDKIPALRDWLVKRAQTEAFKQAAAGNAKSVGGKLAREGGQGRAEQVGQFILDEGLLPKGDAPAALLEAARDIKRTAGTEIGNAIGQSGATVHLPDLISKLENGVLANARSGGSAYSQIASKVEGIVGDLRDMQANLGADVPAEAVHQLKVKLAGLIDFGSDKAMASALQQTVGTMAGGVHSAVKAAGAGDALKEANRRFGLAADLEKAAKKGSEAVFNRNLGVSELGTGGAGAVVGALSGGPAGAALGSVAGGVAANMWRSHGSGISARAMAGGAATIDAVTARLAAHPNLQPYLDLLRRTAAASGPAAAASVHFMLTEKDPAYRAATSEQKEGQ